MPEAPEIRQYSDDLNDFFEDHKLTEIKILAGRYKRHEVPDHLNELNKLLPQKIKDIKTKGKFIYVILENNYVIAMTMGLSGFFTEDDLKHNNIEFKTINGSIFMNDMRNFGTLSIFKNIEQLQKKLDKIGPDIFYITENQFVEIIKSAPSAKIGEFLMKQPKIAGIGNYLRADILWMSKISPFRKIKDLTLQEIKNIFINSQKLIWYFYDYKQGIKDKIISKTDKFPIDYDRDFFAYGEKKDINGHEVKTDTLGGRTIHYVPDHQK